MFEYFGVYSTVEYNSVDIMVIIKEEYCKNYKKSERMIQFNIKDDKICFIEGKESAFKKEVYSKYKEEINKLLKKLYNDMYFEIIQCETNIKDMILIMNINHLNLRLENGMTISCNFKNCVLDENPYDKFTILINNKKINKKIKKGNYTTEDLLKKIKIMKNKLPEKILIELEKNNKKTIIEDNKNKKFAKKKKL